MGLAIPRPAIRAREDRVVRTRIRFMFDLQNILQAAGVAIEAASKMALKEAQALPFNRAGQVKKGYEL